MEQKQKNVAQTELEEELFQLRQHLKDREKRKTGRTPQICPDDSLREIARLMPRKASDFYSIPGIGPSFVENFSQDFLNLLSKHTKEGSSPIPVNRSVEETLRELSKKLINIKKWLVVYMLKYKVLNLNNPL